MIIEVWSDVVCPWCFIGKRRLEKALAQLSYGDEIIVRHRAFELAPDAQETVPTGKYLAEKYRVSSEEVRQMEANVCAVADDEGLCYDLDKTLSGNTFDAHRLLLWAATFGKQDQLLEAMYSGYFEKSLPLFSHQDLCSIAGVIGIQEAEIIEILTSDQFKNEVRADRELALALGVTGVPYFLVDKKFAISGAQPSEVFIERLERAWREKA